MLLLFLHCEKKTSFNFILKRENRYIQMKKKKISFNLIVKRENRYKQTKMNEIKLYIYKVIEMDKMMEDWCVWKVRRGVCVI